MTVWLSRQAVLAIHDEQLAEHGGAAGVRDAGLPDSALARPLNHASCGEPDITVLAALYAMAMVQSHPFVDGNKRTAYVMLETFLELNGLTFPVSDMQAVVAMLSLPAGDSSDEEFIVWVRSNATIAS